MQDNIRITSPINTNDPTAAKLRAPKEGPQLNPIDPNRVNPKNNTEASKNESFQFLLNHKSVYNRFIQQLMQTPGLSETLKKVVFDAFVQGERPTRIATTMDPILKELAEKLKLNPDQIVEALKYQNDNQTKYHGPMFDLFRELAKAQKGNQEFEQLLGQFLKAYNGYLSMNDTLKSIVANLKTIAQRIPKMYSDQLNTLVERLIVDQSENSLESNLSTLKNEIIPFLSSYIGKTNDFGRVRDTITLLIHNIARFNMSSKEEVINKFVDLIDYCKFQFDMPDKNIDVLKRIFANEISNPKIPQNDLYDTFAKAISEGITSDQSATSKAIYRDISTALLLDNSVFMPLTHLFLPVNYQGTFFFSELWIDKNAKGKPNPETGEVKAAMKLFITFDIKGLGYFEATVLLSDKNADVVLSCPSTLAQSEREIRSNITKIFLNNGISVNSLTTSKGQSPQKIQDVFETLYDRRQGIDVTI
ncbi:hypothetical protein RBG61_07785 [Paludicola sp. MB14-C6]|uniref:hypothetical protein n=1 Tax=Paludihabitans sp. MB14-C6 TaxID=3070656 RepID=UPI0027DD2E5F|nr:hypothetical protein [Paludicola sp. MB14-C6]WMJ21903.1 hypothetical protein RBG61_07785 [Paludicola sp. MB14-C6]